MPFPRRYPEEAPIVEAEETAESVDEKVLAEVIKSTSVYIEDRREL